MADAIVIEATRREGRGKGYARKLRGKGLIPGNLLEKGKSTSIEMNPKLLQKVYAQEGRKFELDFEGQKRVVSIKEMQIHPVKRVALHVDLIDR